MFFLASLSQLLNKIQKQIHSSRLKSVDIPIFHHFFRAKSKLPAFPWQETAASNGPCEALLRRGARQRGFGAGAAHALQGRW